jgi:hypothetical protein
MMKIRYTKGNRIITFVLILIILFLTSLAFPPAQPVLTGSVFHAVQVALTPSDVDITINNSSYLFSKETQQYLEIAATSHYAANKSIIIIEEPHYNLEQQYNLYKGLEVFFDDNPQLVNSTIFLSEGSPSNQGLSVKPLVDIEPAPSDDLIKEVLGSFLIPGYLAYEWKHYKDIPIVGTEDTRLYNLSVAIWVDATNQTKNAETANLWAFTVIVRNADMIKTLSGKTENYENPILFVGGLHMDKQEDFAFQAAEHSLIGSDAGLMGGYENLGLADYLRKMGIGFTYVRAIENPVETAGMFERDFNTYRELFKAQQSGNYDRYVECFLWDYYGVALNGVTVTPAVDAATNLVNQLAKGSRTPSHGEPDSTQTFPSPEGGTTEREYGHDGEAVKDIDRGHDHGAGDPHIHDWDWTKSDGEKRGPGRPPNPREISG